jgi:hypothetical protein
LAPLELVMALPMLLMILGLMVIYGNAASWKIRAETVSRDAAWRMRWPRQDGFQPPPTQWPSTAAMSVHAGNSIAVLDDPALRHPVVRGPLPAGVDVNERLLNFSRGVSVGFARIRRDPPMLASLGQYRLEVQNPLLNDRFQYSQMGLGGNRRRRVPRIYDMPSPPFQLVQAYREAVAAIENAPFAEQLRPLDRDDEFLAYLGHAPDFHPRLGSFCSLDALWVQEQRVEPLQDRIEDLPERMARAFIGLYRRRLAAVPPPSPQAQDDLRRKIRELEQFLMDLQNRP